MIYIYLFKIYFIQFGRINSSRKHFETLMFYFDIVKSPDPSFIGSVVTFVVQVSENVQYIYMGHL